MNRLLKMSAAVCATAMLPGLLPAQVLLRLRSEHTQLVRYETVNLFVSVLNESPYLLTFGGDNGARLEFLVERGHGSPVDRFNKRPLIEDAAIEAGRSRDILCDISRWYNLVPVGSYSVRAIVEWRGNAYQSERVRFDVVNGLPIGSQTRTMWADEEFTRQFSLCYLAREGTEHLFLSVDDSERGINYGLFDLGLIVRLHAPVLRVGREGSVHVLHQSGFGRYTYNTLEVDSESARFVDQSYRGKDGKPLGRAEAPELRIPENIPPDKPAEKESSLFRRLFRKNSGDR